MIFTVLLLKLCLISNPDACFEKQFTFDAQSVTPMQCTFGAMSAPPLQAWLRRRPDYRIGSFKCTTSDKFGEGRVIIMSFRNLELMTREHCRNGHCNASHTG